MLCTTETEGEVTVYCKRCGVMNDKRARVCVECGAPLSEEQRDRRPDTINSPPESSRATQASLPPAQSSHRPSTNRSAETYSRAALGFGIFSLVFSLFAHRTFYQAVGPLFFLFGLNRLIGAVFHLLGVILNAVCYRRASKTLTLISTVLYGIAFFLGSTSAILILPSFILQMLAYIQLRKATQNT